MIKFLRKWGYYIGDVSGKINIKSNILDFVLFTVYFVLSVANTISSNPSVMVFALNVISICRLIIKNYMDQCKVVSDWHPPAGSYSSAGVTKSHVIKITAEAISLILLVLFVIINIFCATAVVNITIKIMTIIVLILTWLENVLSMIERLYDAKPQLLLVCSAQN